MAKGKNKGGSKLGNPGDGTDKASAKKKPRAKKPAAAKKNAPRKNAAAKSNAVPRRVPKVDPKRASRGLDDNEFWNVIDVARRRATGMLEKNGRSADPEDLRAVLETLDDTEVHGFGRRFYELLCDLNRWPIWQAGDAIGGGLSGDSFHYFRSWLIGKGRDAVLVARTDPDGLGVFCSNDEVAAFRRQDDWPENEELEYVAVKILEARGLGDPRDDVPRDPDGVPEGEPPEKADFETNLRASRSKYPRLGAKFAGVTR